MMELPLLWQQWYPRGKHSNIGGLSILRSILEGGGRENTTKAAVHSFSPSKTDLFREASGTTVRGKVSCKQRGCQRKGEKKSRMKKTTK